MATSSDEPRTPLDAFLAAFWKDVDGWAVRPLADYLARFPGDDAAIAREYEAFINRGPAAVAGSPGQPSADRVAHYRKIRQIGRGGQGTVYLAEDTHLHRQVALKIMDPGFASDAIAVERFKREAEITSKLDHPGICTVYETGEDRGSRWIAMRYIEGESLATKVSTAKEGHASGSTSTFVVLSKPDHRDATTTPTPPPTDRTGPKTWADISRLLLLFEDAARALHAAHEVGVIHRDIKPGNMMVAEDGKLVILDFGLAVDMGSDLPTLTMSGDLMGTKEYMSPEQIAAHRITLDRRTDVYSLGVSLFECLALRRPFEAPTREGLYEAIMTKAPPDLRRLNPAIPSDLRVVVATAIEKERDRRYQTALDLAEELRRVRMHEPIVAKPVGPLVRLARWAQRNPGLAAMTGGLFAVLVAGLAVALFLLDQRDRALADVTTERDAKNTALTAKQTALAQVTTERNDKQAALSDYDRLGDLSRLRELQREADRLWPAETSMTAPLTAWITKAADLRKRLSDHTEVWQRLRAQASELPYTEEDRAADLKAHRSEQLEIARLQYDRWQWTNFLSHPERPRPDNLPASRLSADAELRSRIAADDVAIVRQTERLHERLTERLGFSEPSEQFKLDTTTTLVEELTRFIDPDPSKGLLAEVRTRLAFAASVDDATIGKFHDRWSKAIGSIGDIHECPQYKGLRITPQLGLIPIDKDPSSGLWEFAHLQTGMPGMDPIPKRGTDGRLVVTAGMGLVLVLLPPGAVVMGGDRWMTPIALDPFFMSKYEMTQGQWARLVGGNPSAIYPGSQNADKVADLRHPVEQISWEDCDRWLTRLRLILPTDAQWEYAARAGTTTQWWSGANKESLRTAENIADESLRQQGHLNMIFESWNDGYVFHAPVGTFAPNPFGLYDMLGNVSEWCRDWWWSADSPADLGDGLRHPLFQDRRLYRGGNYEIDAPRAVSTFRYGFPPAFRCEYLGVRPARRLDP